MSFVLLIFLSAVSGEVILKMGCLLLVGVLLPVLPLPTSVLDFL
nr:MAG TPA: hypothetical protein [Caudoviricetes sp.]